MRSAETFQRKGFPASNVRIGAPSTIPPMRQAEFNYADQWIQNNMFRVMIFIPPEHQTSEQNVQYMQLVAARIYRHALYPFPQSYMPETPNHLQFDFNVRYWQTVRYAETWLCDNMYYRWPDTFMAPLIIRKVYPEKENQGNVRLNKIYVQNTRTDCFLQYEIVMRCLHRVNPRRYVDTFSRCFLDFESDLANYSFDMFTSMLHGIPSLDAFREDDLWFTAVLEYLGPLLKWSTIPQNTAFYITKLPMHMCTSPAMTTPLRWKDLLVDYTPEQCLVLSPLL